MINLRLSHMGDPDPRWGVEIQLGQYLIYMQIAYFIVFLGPITKKACLRILIF